MEFVIDDNVLNSFNSLVAIDLQLYDEMFEKLIYLDKNGLMNTPDADRILKKIKVLKIKEKRILDNIKDIGSYSMFYELFGYETLKQMIPDKRVAESIYTRIGVNLIEYENASEREIDDDYEFDEEDVYYEEEICDPIIDTRLSLNFLKHLNANADEILVDVKYKMCFEKPNVDNELSLIGYNVNNLTNITDEDFAEISDMKLEDYLSDYEDVCVQYMDLNLKEFLSAIGDVKASKTDISIALAKLKFLFNQVDVSVLEAFDQRNSSYGIYETEVLEENVHFVSECFNALGDSIVKRDSEYFSDYALDGENPVINPVDSNLVDQICELIKVINGIYGSYQKLAYLEINGKKESKEFLDEISKVKKLFNLETEIAQSMVIDDETLNVTLMDIVDDCFEIITGMIPNIDFESQEQVFDSFKHLNKKELIKLRIQSIFNNLTLPDDYAYASLEVPQNIMRNYKMASFTKFDKYIEDELDKEKLVEVKYEDLFVCSDLTSDFVSGNGDFSEASIMSEDLLCDIFDLDIDEYLFDRNKLLYNYANLIIDRLSKSQRDQCFSDLELARAKFQTICFETAMELLDDESTCKLNEIYLASADENSSHLYKNLGKILQHKKGKTYQKEKVVNKRH